MLCFRPERGEFEAATVGKLVEAVGRRHRWTFVIVLILIVAGGSVAVALSEDDRGQPSASGSSQSPATNASGAPSPWSPSAEPPRPIPGYLLIADRGNDRMLLVDSRKRVLWRYPARGSKPSFPFHFDDDAFFAPDYQSVITNEEEQHTIEVISFPGQKVLWHYGHVDAPGSRPGYLHTPDDAYLLADGTRTVADVDNCRILFISPAGHVVKRIGTTGVCRHHPPADLASPNGDTPLPDGGTLVTEIGGSWIDAFDAHGRLEWQVHAPVRYPSDAQWLGDGRILVADYSDPGHILIMTTGGKVIWKYGPPSGAGALNHPSLAIMLPNGLIAVNDDFRHRVLLISVKRRRIVWQYGHTDVPGRSAGYLRIPDGMDFLPFDAAMRIPAIRSLVSG
jgi:hypothetical protein